MRRSFAALDAADKISLTRSSSLTSCRSSLSGLLTWPRPAYGRCRCRLVRTRFAACREPPRPGADSVHRRVQRQVKVLVTGFRHEPDRPVPWLLGYFLGAGISPPFRGIRAAADPGALHHAYTVETMFLVDPEGISTAVSAISVGHQEVARQHDHEPSHPRRVHGPWVVLQRGWRWFSGASVPAQQRLVRGAGLTVERVGTSAPVPRASRRTGLRGMQRSRS